MDVKVGYTQTDIGILPSNWDIKTLRSITTLLTNGFVGKATDFYVNSDDGILYIQGYNVEENGFNLHGVKHVSKKFHIQHNKSCLQSGDLLTIQTGDIGITTVVPDALAGANCHALIISRFYKDKADPNYYCQYFNSGKNRSFFKEIETGTTMKHLNVGDMAAMLLPVPPILEQHDIATALSNVDAHISSLSEIIAKKRDVKQAAMQELLTGKRRLLAFDTGKGYNVTDFGLIPEDWDILPLERIADPNRAIRYGIVQVGPFTNDGIPVLAIKNLNTDYITNIHRSPPEIEKPYAGSRVHPGDILISVKGTTGRIGIVPPHFEGNISRDLARLALTDMDVPEFWNQMLQTESAQQRLYVETVGTTRQEISIGILKQIKMPRPPHEEQRAIATVLSDMDAELAALEQKRDKTKAIKQGMMQELLTGRIRLM
jgi:type I restriction enzyme S subunit